MQAAHPRYCRLVRLDVCRARNRGPFFDIAAQACFEFRRRVKDDLRASGVDIIANLARVKGIAADLANAPQNLNRRSPGSGEPVPAFSIRALKKSYPYFYPCLLARQTACCRRAGLALTLGRSSICGDAALALHFLTMRLPWGGYLARTLTTAQPTYPHEEGISGFSRSEVA